MELLSNAQQRIRPRRPVPVGLCVGRRPSARARAGSGGAAGPPPGAARRRGARGSAGRLGAADRPTPRFVALLPLGNGGEGGGPRGVSTAAAACPAGAAPRRTPAARRGRGSERAKSASRVPVHSVGGGSAPFAEWNDSGSGRALHAHRGRGVRHSSCRDGRRALQEGYAGGQRRAPGIRLRAARRAFPLLHLMQGVTTVLN